MLDKTEGNPLFVEEVIRMLAERPGLELPELIPDTLQALIAARIDRLPPPAKTLLQRASVVGRTFWQGAVAHLAPDLEDLEALVEDLHHRDFILREPRSTITGERAYRFKHVLIREVAYSGLAKEARAQYHARFADWLRERAGDELAEIRAYHLDQAAVLLTELDGAPPPALAADAGEALELAGKRAFAQEVFKSARKLLARSVELEPTLERRFLAARAAWRAGDFTAVSAEMERVREEAHGLGDSLLEVRALTSLSDARMRQGLIAEGAELIEQALALLTDGMDPEAHFEALVARSTVASLQLEMPEVVHYLEEAFAVGLAAGRKDMQTIAAQGLAQAHIIRLELDSAEPLLAKAIALAEESGSVRAKANATMALGWLHQVRGELDGARRLYEEVRTAAGEMGSASWQAYALCRLGYLAVEQGEPKRAEKLLREAIRAIGNFGELADLGDSYAFLALALAQQGRVEEAEQYARKADEVREQGDLKTMVPHHVALADLETSTSRIA
jgi:tetratricopeptide (TPR) repeat protein